jgi:hypothetical protein
MSGVPAGWFEATFSCPASAASAPDGQLFLAPAPPPTSSSRSWRAGRFVSSTGGTIELSIGHSPGSARFCYLRTEAMPASLARLVGLSTEEAAARPTWILPGQLLLGPERTAAAAEGVRSLVASPTLSFLRSEPAGSVAVFPVLREGLKYGVADALWHETGLMAGEVVVDSHHVYDPDVAGYGRRAVVSLFKDNDWTTEERAAVRTAFVADSVAGGVVLQSVLREVTKRFPRIERVELIAPLITLHGLARLAAAQHLPPLRVHCFETVLNALAPNFYDSAQMGEAVWHIDAERAAAYRRWWGRDSEGRWIADSLCAGVGWSEAFFTPAEQIRMLTERLHRNHLSLAAAILRGQEAG